jgi:transposase
MSKTTSLTDLYRFPGFRALRRIRIVDSTPTSDVLVTLVGRRKKTVCSVCGFSWSGFGDKRVRRVRDLSSGLSPVYLLFDLRRVDCQRCKRVKTEKLDWLADNTSFTRRFAALVGRMSRECTVSEVARELGLDWHTVCDLDMTYMREQLELAGEANPLVLGIDEISVGPRHQYRIVVSDLERGQPIWFGGTDRKEASLALFFRELGPAKCKKIR